MIVIGAFAVLVALVAAVLDVGLVGIGPVYFASCGAPLFPTTQVGVAVAGCAGALAEQLTFAVVVGVAGVLVVAGGAVVAWRNAR
jgi:hypothetical protein